MRKSSHIAVLCFFLLLAVTLVGGCDLLNTTPQQRVATMQSAVNSAAATSAKLGAGINSLQVAIADGKVILADPNLDPALQKKINESLTKAQAALAITTAKKAHVDTAVNNLKLQIDTALKDPTSVNFGTELGIYGTGVSGVSSMLPPQYAAIGYGIGAILTAVGGYYTRKQLVENPKVATLNEKIDKALTALDEVVTGNEVFKANAAPETLQLFSEAHEQIQTAPTVAAVAAIKAS